MLSWEHFPQFDCCVSIHSMTLCSCICKLSVKQCNLVNAEVAQHVSHSLLQHVLRCIWSSGVDLSLHILEKHQLCTTPKTLCQGPTSDLLHLIEKPKSKVQLVWCSSAPYYIRVSFKRHVNVFYVPIVNLSFDSGSGFLLFLAISRAYVTYWISLLREARSSSQS